VNFQAFLFFMAVCALAAAVWLGRFSWPAVKWTLGIPARAFRRFRIWRKAGKLRRAVSRRRAAVPEAAPNPKLTRDEWLELTKLCEYGQDGVQKYLDEMRRYGYRVPKKNGRVIGVDLAKKSSWSVVAFDSGPEDVSPDFFMKIQQDVMASGSPATLDPRTLSGGKPWSRKQLAEVLEVPIDWIKPQHELVNLVSSVSALTDEARRKLRDEWQRNSEPSPASSKHKPGQWVRNTKDGMLYEIVDLYHRGAGYTIWTMERNGLRFFEDEDYLGLAYPKVGEVWKFNSCTHHGPASYPLKWKHDFSGSEHSIAATGIKCGCYVPVNYGRGNQ